MRPIYNFRAVFDNMIRRMLEWLSDVTPEDDALKEVAQVRLEIARILGTLANCQAIPMLEYQV